MIILKGDTVALDTGEQAEVVEVWGIVREYARVRLLDGSKDIVPVKEIKAIIKRESGGKRGRSP